MRPLQSIGDHELEIVRGGEISIPPDPGDLRAKHNNTTEYRDYIRRFQDYHQREPGPRPGTPSPRPGTEDV